MFIILIETCANSKFHSILHVDVVSTIQWLVKVEIRSYANFTEKVEYTNFGQIRKYAFRLTLMNEITIYFVKYNRIKIFTATEKSFRFF